MGAWRYRIGRDDKGELHFVMVRYDEVDKPQFALRPLLSGNSLDDMRQKVDYLTGALDHPIVGLALGKDGHVLVREPPDEDEDDEDDEDDDEPA